MYVHYASGTMWNQLFLNKKNADVNDLEGVCLSTFTGCQLPFFCSTAAQCEAAAAVADLRALVLCKAAALPVVVHGSGATFLKIQLVRSADWEILCALVLPCFASPCFCVLCFCNGRDTCFCASLMVVAGGAHVSFLSHHTTMRVFTNVCKCITGEKYQRHCVFTCTSGLRIWPFSCMQQCVWFVNVSGNGANRGSEEVFCDNKGHTQPRGELETNMLGPNKPWILLGSKAGCLRLSDECEGSECGRYPSVSDANIWRLSAAALNIWNKKTLYDVLSGW